MLRSIVGRKIAVDFDEVLFPMVSQLNKHYAKKYQKQAPKYAPQYYNYSNYYNISDHESKVLVESFYHSNFAYVTKPIKYAPESLKELKKYNDLYVVTGRQTYKQCKYVTHYLIYKYFDGIFNDVCFTNSYSLKGKETPKSDICKALNIDLLIDDSISNCKEVQSHNIEGILYGNYAWNQDGEDLCRIDSWENFQSS